MKLFLDAPDPVSGFQAYVFDGMEKEAAPELPLEAATPESLFGLPDAFWQWMSADPELRVQFDRMIDDRVKQGLEKRFIELREQVEKEAHQVGLQNGLAEAAARVHESEAKLTALCGEILRHKTSLMHDHEIRWALAFSHLLKRFLVPGREMALETLRSWLSESLASFEKNGRVRIHLAQEDYLRLRENLPTIAEKNWEFLADGNLKPGDVHCECDGGGILFNEGAELERLNNWIERFNANLGEHSDES